MLSEKNNELSPNKGSPWTANPKAAVSEGRNIAARSGDPTHMTTVTAVPHMAPVISERRSVWPILSRLPAP